MRLPHFDQWEVVKITWVDSNGGRGGWHKLKPRETEIEGCTSAGMVHSQSADRVTLVLSREEMYDNVDGAITIPAAAVKTVERMVRARS